METEAVDQIVQAIRDGSAAAVEQLPVLTAAIQRRAVVDAIGASLFALIFIGVIVLGVKVFRSGWKRGKVDEDDRFILGGLICFVGGVISCVSAAAILTAIRHIVGPEITLLDMLTG